MVILITLMLVCCGRGDWAIIFLAGVFWGSLE